MILSYNGIKPIIGENVFIAQSAEVIGDIIIGDNSSIWFQCLARGDVNSIRIGSGTNIQDHCVLHVTGGAWDLNIGSNVTAGHRAILHGCDVMDNVLVGMGAIVLDGAVVESNSMVGAGSVVPPGFRVPSGTLVMGVPAKVKRELTEQEIISIEESAKNYVKYALTYQHQYDSSET